MTKIVTLSGSPSFPSRSASALAWIRQRLDAEGFETEAIEVRELPPAAVLHGQFSDPAVQAAVLHLTSADAVVIATPIYKASYAGVLKAFLDLLPQDIFAGKSVLPIATGGSLAHLLVLDYALNPVLSTLGARHVLRGVYLPDSQVQRATSGVIHLAPEAEERLCFAIQELTNHLFQKS